MPSCSKQTQQGQHESCLKQPRTPFISVVALVLWFRDTQPATTGRSLAPSRPAAAAPALTHNTSFHSRPTWLPWSIGSRHPKYCQSNSHCPAAPAPMHSTSFLSHPTSLPWPIRSQVSLPQSPLPCSACPDAQHQLPFTPDLAPLAHPLPGIVASIPMALQGLLGQKKQRTKPASSHLPHRVQLLHLALHAVQRLELRLQLAL